MLDFVNPWLLWGALLGAVPLVIHFLQRRNWNEVDWGAMLFLQAAAKRRQRQSRVESLLLLGVRCLIPIVVAIALAQPIFSGFSSSPSGRSPRLWVFVVDRTASMQTEVDGRSYFDAARDAVLRALDQARPGDSFMLLGLSGVSDSGIVSEPTFDREEFARVVRGLEPTLEGNVNRDVLIDLPERIRQSKQARVVILSDFPADDWEHAGGIHEQLAEIAALANVSLINVAGGPVDNSGVISLRVEPHTVSRAAAQDDESAPSADSELTTEAEGVTVQTLDEADAEPQTAPPAIVSVNQPAVIAVRLRRHETPAADSPPSTSDKTNVQVAVDGIEIHGSSIHLPAGELVELRVPWTPARPGSHRVAVTLSSDALAADNARHCVVDVEDRLDVLIIDGAPHVPASRFVELALNPWREASQTATAAGPLLEVTTAGIERLSLGDFSAFDVVVLCDVPVLSDADVARLLAFVESGGGLIVGLGDAAGLDSYARRAFVEEGLCELDVGEAVGDPEVLEEPFQIVMNQPGHPVLVRFAAHPLAGLQTARLHRYVQLEIPETSSANVILSLNTGDPLLIEQKLGRGRSLVLSTALDDRWGSWVLWPSFVPLIHEMVTHAATGNLQEQSLNVGDMYRRWLPDGALTLRYQIESPDLETSALRTSFGIAGLQGEAGPLLLPGIYEVTSSDVEADSEYVAVNVSAAESEAAGADLDAIDRISNRIHIHSVQSWQRSARITSETTDLESILARWLLAVVLCLLLIEPVLARRFRVGVILLLALSATIATQFVMMLAW